MMTKKKTALMIHKVMIRPGKFLALLATWLFHQNHTAKCCEILIAKGTFDGIQTVRYNNRISLFASAVGKRLFKKNLYCKDSTSSVGL